MVFALYGEKATKLFLSFAPCGGAVTPVKRFRTLRSAGVPLPAGNGRPRAPTRLGLVWKEPSAREKAPFNPQARLMGLRPLKKPLVQRHPQHSEKISQLAGAQTIEIFLPAGCKAPFYKKIASSGIPSAISRKFTSRRPGRRGVAATFFVLA